VENLLNFKNIDKENLEKIIENILSINLKTLNQIDSMTLLQFNESSTRTRLSFNVAAQLLGLKILENQDAISARVKGEILDHEIDTYKSLGVETLVVRTKENNIVDYENFEDFSVISGGFGNSSHPTQALIDISTLIKFDKLSYEIPITYVGDLKHSRVFSSGRELLTKLGYKVGVLTNKDLLPDNLDNLHIFNSWEEVIKYSGSVELLRIQKERLKNLDGFDFEDFIKNFQLNNEILESAKKDFIVMHPMPINIGIEIDKEALKNNRFIYKEQLKLATKTRVVSYQFAYGEI
jgi:aspartate carbamoyltransferase catalytic subunit